MSLRQAAYTPRAFSTFLSRTVNGKARFPHLHSPRLPPTITEEDGERARERKRDGEVDELARRLSSLHEAGVSEKWGAWVERGGEFGGRRLEGEWYPCAKAHWQHPVSSRTSGRTLRSFLSRGEKTLFSFLSPARHIPLSTFDSTGGVEYDDAYPKANVSQTRPPTHR